MRLGAASPIFIVYSSPPVVASLISIANRSPVSVHAPIVCLPSVSCLGVPPAADTTKSSSCTPRFARK